MTNIAVILPSRGLVFSKTVEELLQELAPYKHQIFWSHGRPIPDCFEIPTQEALKGDFTHLLVIEEDMIIPKGAIKDMLALDKHAVAFDYPVTGDKGGTVLYDPDGMAYFTGCGILLVKMDIIRSLKPPIWRVDIEWNLKYANNLVEFTIEKVSALKNYGQQDIAFGLRLYYQGRPIYVMPYTAGQRKLEKRGAGRTNRGTHDIVEYTDVEKQDYVQYMESDYKDPFMQLETEDGIVNVSPLLGKKLLEQGLGREIKKGHALFFNTKILEGWL